MHAGKISELVIKVRLHLYHPWADHSTNDSFICWMSLMTGLEYGMDDGMESGMEQWWYTITVNSCNWFCSISVELPHIALGLMSHCFMSIAHMLLCLSMVLLLARLVFSLKASKSYSYCSLWNPDTHMKSKSLASQNYSCGMEKMRWHKWWSFF